MNDDDGDDKGNGEDGDASDCCCSFGPVSSPDKFLLKYHNSRNCIALTSLFKVNDACGLAHDKLPTVEWKHFSREMVLNSSN